MRNLVESMRDAERHGGKPALAQLAEALRLRLGRQKIGLGEYFDYGIWHRDITPSMQDEFIGWRQSAALDQSLNFQASRVLANDKLCTYFVLLNLGFPIPAPMATFSRTGRRIASEPVLRTLDDVDQFLTRETEPFYVKPISAGYGRGVLGVTSRADGVMNLMDGRAMPIAEFKAPFKFLPYEGMLFQRPLKAHPSVAELTGTDAISCVRFICVVTPSGPKIHTAFWKVVTGRNMLDNFSHGHFGNCLAAIDLERGNVSRAISKLGPGGVVEHHPSTGRPLIGFPLPNWAEARDLVLSASAHFPGLRLQNWDVALCPSGPVLVELNTESELAIPQAISGSGLMDARLLGWLAEIHEGDRLRAAAIASR